MSTRRAAWYRQLEPSAWPRPGFSPFNRAIIAAILCSVAVATLESEPAIEAALPGLMTALTAAFAVLFTLEYLLRLWTVVERPDYAGASGRLRYVLTWPSLIDLAALLSLWADLLLMVPGTAGVMLRLLRILRVITLARHTRFARGLRLLAGAVVARRVELGLSAALAGMVLMFSATALYLIEGDVQPEAFGSIPRALWWAVATLTTVGYGDVYPVTAAGRLVAGTAALTAIAIVALPTGIMAAAFSDAFQRLREADE